MLIGKNRLVAYAAISFTVTRHRNPGSREVLALQRVYVIDALKAICHEQTSSLDTTLIEQLTQSIDAAKVNLRKHRSPVGRSAVPNLGVTCPPFLPVRSIAALTVRHTLSPAHPTDAPLRRPASPGETGS